MVNLSGVLDGFIADSARGEGEALTAVAVSMGISPEDVMLSLVEMMKSNPELAKYAS